MDNTPAYTTPRVAYTLVLHARYVTTNDPFGSPLVILIKHG
ncbi:hypothetical protein HanPSC8_Chr05g0210831 [Helianthus annuus]|nr:hypothetical protein HanPSC8_Chr05g0210831 [Helianthus annuus]